MKKKVNLFQGGGINVLLLGAASFLNDLSSEMIAPILPMFITALGGAGIVVGVVGGIRDSLSSILLVFFGYWSDRTGRRKPFVYSGYAVSSIFKLFLGFCRTWPAVLVFSGLERTGKGMRTAPRDAIIADSLPQQKGKGFGIHRALDTSGAILGASMMFLLFWFWGFDFKAIILLAAGIAFFSLIPLYFVQEKEQRPQKITLRIGLGTLPPSLRRFILVSTVFALGNFSYMFFILRASGLFTGKFSTAAPILLYILFNIFYALFSVPFGALSDHIGRRKVLMFGYLLFALTCFGFVLFTHLWALAVLFALYGVVHAVVDGNQKAYIADLSSPGLKGTALGTFHTVTGMAALPAGLVAGLLWQKAAPEATFLFGSAAGLTAAVLFAGFKDDVK